MPTVPAKPGRLEEAGAHGRDTMAARLNPPPMASPAVCRQSPELGAGWIGVQVRIFAVGARSCLDRTGRGIRSRRRDREFGDHLWVLSPAIQSGLGLRISDLARGALGCSTERPNERERLITLPGMSRKPASRGASIHGLSNELPGNRELRISKGSGGGRFRQGGIPDREDWHRSYL